MAEAAVVKSDNGGKKIYFYLFGVLRRFQHCTGHITTGSWKGRGNQYIEFVRVLYCKLPTNGKQLPAFPHKALTGIKPRPQRWEASVTTLPPWPLGGKKRKSDTAGGSKSTKSTAKISESFEVSLSSLLMSNVRTNAYNENAMGAYPYTTNEGRDGVIKRTFHLGGSKYVNFHGTQGLIENIYLKEWEDGEVKTKGLKLSIPKLVVILHYVEFIMSSIQKISDGKREVDSSYHLGSSIYVTCATPYRNVSIRFWKTANGKRYPTPEGMSCEFNELDEFIKVAQRMYTEYSEIYSYEPCILDENRSGHDIDTCEECKQLSCRGEVKEDIPL